MTGYFFISITDIVTIIHSFGRYRNKTYYSTILYSHKNPEVISEKLGKELESCSKWLIDNKLSLHLGKTETILFGSKRKLSKIRNFDVTCNNHTISSQNCVKYLGLNIDNSLSGEFFLNNIIQKINSRLKFLYRQAKCLSEQSRKTLVTALIQCHFDYACSAWYAGVSKKYKDKLQVLQNKCVRFIKNTGYRSKVDHNVLNSIGYVNIENRVKQLRLNHVHNIYYHHCPDYMYSNFTKVRHLHHHFTRNSEYNFWVPPVKSQQKDTFYFNGIQDWNMLPIIVKKIKKIKEFKSSVKEHLTKT
ncbi:unnamed protein product [Mytilus edulis]|uniref:Uncharacterized protein n=1 Tax=Mytilus edulis TaxID=6550 RepID=A0A8S3SKF5_MYTED|nr:unnamed protein product [Mytilus edulis]